MNQVLLFLQTSHSMHFLYSLMIILLLSALGLFLAKRLIPTTAYKFIGRVKPRWLTCFQSEDTFKHLIYAFPVIFIYFSLNSLDTYFKGEFFSEVFEALRKVLISWLIVHLMFFVSALTNTVLAIYQQYPIAKIRPIKGFVQVATLIVYITGASSIVIVLLDRDPGALLTTIGGGSIVLGLIFKDTILSFIAGIQIASNRLIQTGDWIEVAKYGADGTVLEVALHVVTVQNFDKTLVTLPTYKLIEEGFKNWRGMRESGGRRIRRAICIDQGTVRFLAKDELEKLKHHDIIRDVMSDLELEPEIYHTNLGLFRGYVEAYLRKHPDIHQDMTFLVRLLEPTQVGIPLQLYIFTNDTAWVRYEKIQSGIFEHIIAIIPLFKLRVYQAPSSNDFNKLSRITA